MTFEVGKTYLTRDGSEAEIMSRNSFTLVGTVTKTNGKRISLMWLPTGSSVYYDDKEMDLMPPDAEPELEGKTARDLCDTVYGVYSRMASYVSDKQEQDGVQHKLKEENAALLSENNYVLVQIEELQKEYGRLHVALREARMIAQGMVEAVKQDSLDDPPQISTDRLCSALVIMCGCKIYRGEDAHSCPFYSFSGKTNNAHCTCCKKCTANCTKMAAQLAVDQTKCATRNIKP